MRWMFFAALLAGLVTLNLPGRADDKPADDKAVRAVIEKAVEKAGGKEKLAKLANYDLSAKGTLEVEGVPVEFTAKTTYHLPGKAVSTLHLETKGKKLDLVQNIDGDTGNAKIGGEEKKKLEGAHLAEAIEEVYGQRVGQLFPLLDDKEFTLAGLPEEKVEGKAAVGVKVSAKGHKDLELYFDKESGLLVKSVRQTVDPRSMKEHRRETFYSDPKDAAGGPKYAGKMVVVDDGKKVADVTVTELNFPNEVKK